MDKFKLPKENLWGQHLVIDLGNSRTIGLIIEKDITTKKYHLGNTAPLRLLDYSKLEKDGVYLKMYGKDISKSQRKLGHFNVVDLNASKDISELLETADEIKGSILIKPLR